MPEMVVIIFTADKIKESTAAPENRFLTRAKSTPPKFKARPLAVYRSEIDKRKCNPVPYEPLVDCIDRQGGDDCANKKDDGQNVLSAERNHRNIDHGRDKEERAEHALLAEHRKKGVVRRHALIEARGRSPADTENGIGQEGLPNNAP
ncbi:MAG: hypothetical protein ACI36T_04945, partial [Eggerthellaceae bacterium]